MNILHPDFFRFSGESLQMQAGAVGESQALQFTSMYAWKSIRFSLQGPNTCILLNCLLWPELVCSSLPEFDFPINEERCLC